LRGASKKQGKSNKPEAYETGNVPFLGADIDLSLRPLIPRPETEFWVERAIAGMKKHVRVLDLFAGSGCIGIAVAKAIPEAHVDFAEINPQFTEQIKINLAKNGIEPERARVYESDMFEQLASETYDYILANPPYVAPGEKIEASVRDWEPHEALFGGAGGLQYVKRTLTEAPRHLAPGGKLYLEFSPRQKAALSHIVTRGALTFYRDQYRRWRFAIWEAKDGTPPRRGKASARTR